jgi:hypothetical protein
MNRIIELVINRVLVPALFGLCFIRLYKTQVISSNAVRSYNRSLRVI